MIGQPSIKSCGQRSLEDDGKRDWNEQIINHLNHNYPDWQNPATTYMIPDELVKQANAGELAEKNVYDLLKGLSEPMFVLHSWKFKERIPKDGKFKLSNTSKLWKIGEHDFVVIHRNAGFVFFQVKAAEKAVPKYKEAQNQLQKDCDSLKIYLSEESSLSSQAKKKAGKLFSKYPGFVVMPNCACPTSGRKLYPNCVFKEDCADFYGWWSANIGVNKDPIDQDLFNLLVTRFVGLATISPCLGDKIDDTCENLKINTTQQLKILLDSSPEKWIVGPAGSGKTCLLMEKVVTLASKIILHSLPEKILVVCYNKPLSLMMSRVFGNALNDMLQGDDLSSVVDVKTFDKLLKDINGKFSEKDGENGVTMALKKLHQDTSCPLRHKYDHVFVDEGQDLYSTEWPRLLQMTRKVSSELSDEEDDDLDPKYFWVFYDSNQHLHLSKENIMRHSGNLKTSTRLCEVLRNTKNVFLQLKKYFHPIVTTSMAVGVYHQEEGLKIEWDGSIQSESSVSDAFGERCVAKHVADLQERNVRNADICILVRDVATRNTLTSNLRDNFGITCQDAEDLWTVAKNNVVVESIRRFKGLESKVIILYDPPFRDERKTRELLYTSISRCFCYLIVISTKEGCEALRSALGYSPGKRPRHEDDASSHSPRLKRVKELEGDAGDSDSEVLPKENEQFSPMVLDDCVDSVEEALAPLKESLSELGLPFPPKLRRLLLEARSMMERPNEPDKKVRFFIYKEAWSYLSRERGIWHGNSFSHPQEIKDVVRRLYPQDAVARDTQAAIPSSIPLKEFIKGFCEEDVQDECVTPDTSAGPSNRNF